MCSASRMPALTTKRQEDGCYDKDDDAWMQRKDGKDDH